MERIKVFSTSPVSIELNYCASMLNKMIMFYNRDKIILCIQIVTLELILLNLLMF